MIPAAFTSRACVDRPKLAKRCDRHSAAAQVKNKILIAVIRADRKHNQPAQARNDSGLTDAPQTHRSQTGHWQTGIARRRTAQAFWAKGCWAEFSRRYVKILYQRCATKHGESAPTGPEQRGGGLGLTSPPPLP